METATLTSPPRPVMVQPVQKSMSLPSYARASGEGIDHKLIFAALEQREKVRRKSKIFKDREKKGTTRQSYFCLPLPSSAKCRETSLSSDTSCSSLEFQKPKYRNSPTKTRKEQSKPEQNGLEAVHLVTVSNNVTPENSPDCNRNNNITDHAHPMNKDLSEFTRKNISGSPTERATRTETFRSIGSSDSMERTEKSSRSSNDSLSRKERLVAIKARVEAERERTLADSSSEEETSLKITRHHADGVVIRTVREVKTKSSRPERRYRRKTQEEYAAIRASRKQHTSLYLPATTDLDSWRPPVLRSGSSLALYRDVNEIAKGNLGEEPKPKSFTSATASHSVLKDSYFSDVCNGSYRSRFVKPRVQEIEKKDRCARLAKDKHPLRQGADCPQSNKSPTTTKERNQYSSIQQGVFANNSKVSNLESQGSSSFERVKKCISPSSRAPTPPPRSPKSIEFVNKAIIHHQNIASSSFYPEACSLERNRSYLRSKLSGTSSSSHPISESFSKEIISSRRKTCSNFAQADQTTFERSKTPTVLQQTKFPSQFPPRSPDLSQKLASVGRKGQHIVKGLAPSVDAAVRKFNSADTQAKKWEKLELDSEKKFNSLENSPSDSPTWTKWRCLPRKKRTSSCSCPPGTYVDCRCDHLKESTSEVWNAEQQLSKSADQVTNNPFRNSLLSAQPSSASHRRSPPIRLSKSEASLTNNLPVKRTEVEAKVTLLDAQQGDRLENGPPCLTRKDATENLNTAMQELEDVYRSLRVSSENLSDRNSETNFKKNDANNNRLHSGVGIAKIPSPIPLQGRIQLDSPIRFIDDDSGLDDKTFSKCDNLKNSNVPSVPLVTKSRDSNPVSDALCIEELFSDLTQQLDLEQKLLRESRKLPNSPVQRRASEASPRSLHNLEKPFAVASDTERASVFTDKYTTSGGKFDPDSTISSIEQRILARKKHKAVRSLSANLAGIMASSGRSTSSVGKAHQGMDNSQLADCMNGFSEKNSENHASKTCSNYLNHNGKADVPNPLTKNAPVEVANACRTHPAEIWQIRVSMDPGSSPTDPSLPTKDHNPSSPSCLRLRSALHRPKAENSDKDKHITSAVCEGENIVPAASQTVREQTAKIVPLNDTELEKLLTTLLSDVSNDAFSEKSTAGVITKKIGADDSRNAFTKENCGYVTVDRGHYLLSMESSEDRTKSEKYDGELLLQPSAKTLDQKLDNDSHCNNNDPNGVHSSSFIPVRTRSNLPQSHFLLQKHKNPNNNRTAAAAVTQQRSSAFVANAPYHRLSPSTPGQSSARRHSLGIDDLSEICACHWKKYCNHDNRFHAVQSQTGSPSTFNVAASYCNASGPTETAYSGCQDDGSKNGNENKLIGRSTCNGSPQAFSPEHLKPVQPQQRFKDKSFIRKSTLNRLEFVQPAHHTGDYMSHYAPGFHPPEQHSTSEPNSDNQPNRPTVDISYTSSVKRRNTSFHFSGKEAFESQSKQDFQQIPAGDAGNKVSAAVNSKSQAEHLKSRSKKNTKGHLAHLKKRSFSAGEQDSLSDVSETSRKSKVCFSAQETHSQEYKAKNLCRRVTPALKKGFVQAHQKSMNGARNCEGAALVVFANGLECNAETAIYICDNSSHVSPKDGLPGSHSACNISEVIPCNEIAQSHQEDITPEDDKHVDDNFDVASQSAECTPLDTDLFTCRLSPTPVLTSHPFPTDDLILSAPQDGTLYDTYNENDTSCSHFASCCSQGIADVTEEVSCLEISSELPETSSATRNGSAGLEAERESAKQISSILRKKSTEEKKEIHGILKNSVEDRLLARQPLSILKHRESSEEKDICSQVDLHSILKKSSEDESSNNSPDIRPILKNTSTDDESSSFGSRPKPILKKRTSFNEDCSYVCFHSGELKPILKKKTINDLSEEQPKPILKTRRKSEEAAAIMSEFSVGARPRAYSADRGVRMALEKKLSEDDFT